MKSTVNEFMSIFKAPFVVSALKVRALCKRPSSRYLCGSSCFAGLHAAAGASASADLLEAFRAGVFREIPFEPTGISPTADRRLGHRSFLVPPVGAMVSIASHTPVVFGGN
jgi:hypothetical protein